MAEKFITLPKLAWENISVGCVLISIPLFSYFWGFSQAPFSSLGGVGGGLLVGYNHCIGTSNFLG
jgi:hypothetical protein